MRGASIRHYSPASLKMSVDVVTFGCRLNAFESEVIACEAQPQARMFADLAEVARVVGNDDKMRGEAWSHARVAFDAAAGFGIASEEKIAVADIMAVRE